MIYNKDFFLKIRLGKLLWELGYFSRLEIPLKYPSLRIKKVSYSDMTDIDNYGIKFNFAFNQEVIVAECKSGDIKDNEIGIWLSGLINLVGASYGILFSKKKIRMKDYLINDNIYLWDEEKLGEIETCNRIDTKILKPMFDIKVIEKTNLFKKNLFKKYFKELRYIQNKFWFDSPDKQIKNLKAIADKFKGKKISEEEKWLIYEIVTLFSIAINKFSKLVYGYKKDEMYKKTVLVYFFGGYKEYKRTEQTAKLLEKKHIPTYFDGFYELINRHTNNAHEAYNLPRFFELVFYSIYQKNVFDKKDCIKDFHYMDLNILFKLSKNVVDFFINEVGLQKEIFEPILKL